MYQATSIKILYNGSYITSESLGAIYCKVDNNSNEDLYVSTRSFKTESSGQNWGTKSRNYFYKEERKPQQFSIELGFYILNDTIARNVSKVFYQDKYIAIIPNDTNRIYYCRVLSSKIRYLSGGGYISFEVETFDEYSYGYDGSAGTSIITTTKNITTTTSFAITVAGDIEVYPKIYITIYTGGSNIKIANASDSYNYVQFGTYTDDNGNTHPLITNEAITVDCDKELVTTNQLGYYRYDNMTGTFIKLKSGSNTIVVTPTGGNFYLTIEYINKYLF